MLNCVVLLMFVQRFGCGLVTKECVANDHDRCSTYESHKKYYCRQDAWTKENCPMLCEMCVERRSTNIKANKQSRQDPVLGCWQHVEAACVSGDDMIRWRGKTVDECKKLCLGYPTCKAFEFGKAHGGSDTSYLEGDCQLNSRSNPKKCDGQKKNLDLYIKLDCATAAKPSASSPMVGTKPTPTPKRISPQHKRIIDFMVGTWQISYADGFEGEFTVLDDGKVLWRSREYWEIYLVPSKNQHAFPSSEGWVMAEKTFRGENSWDYYRLTGNGKMEIRSFWREVCTSRYRSLNDYCFTGKGKRMDSITAESDSLKDLQGAWELSDEYGFRGYFVIRADGKILIESRDDWTSQLERSDQQSAFPSSQGWVMASNTYRGEDSWEYYKRNGDQLEIETFWKGGCFSDFRNLQHHCGSWQGYRDEDRTDPEEERRLREQQEKEKEKKRKQLQREKEEREKRKREREEEERKRREREEEERIEREREEKRRRLEELKKREQERAEEEEKRKELEAGRKKQHERSQKEAKQAAEERRKEEEARRLRQREEQRRKEEERLRREREQEREEKRKAEEEKRKASPFFDESKLKDVPTIEPSFDGVWTVLYRDNSKAQVTFAPYKKNVVKTTAVVHLTYSTDSKYFPRERGWYMAETLYSETGERGDTWAFFRASARGRTVEIEAFGKHCVREYLWEKKFYCSSGYAIEGEYLITYLINELVGKWKVTYARGPGNKYAISTSGNLKQGSRIKNLKLSNNETFPFNHGWVMTTDTNDGVFSQEYYRYDDDGTLDIQSFSTDPSCRQVFYRPNDPNVLGNYCFEGEGTRGKGSKRSKKTKKTKKEKKEKKKEQEASATKYTTASVTKAKVTMKKNPTKKPILKKKAKFVKKKITKKTKKVSSTSTSSSSPTGLTSYDSSSMLNLLRTWSSGSSSSSSPALPALPAPSGVNWESWTDTVKSTKDMMDSLDSFVSTLPFDIATYKNKKKK